MGKVLVNKNVDEKMRINYLRSKLFVKLSFPGDLDRDLYTGILNVGM